eukprot:305633_1
MVSLLFALSITLFSVLATDNPVVVVIGDSWGTHGHDNLQKVLRQKGTNLTVKSYARGGTTTDWWAKKPNLVSEIVSENPTAEYVWLTIGGNDVIDFMPDCTQDKTIQQCIDIILPRAMNNTQTFLDPLVKDHSKIKIVQFGYDLPNLQENVLCRSIGKDIINGCDGVASCINPQFAKVQTLYVDALPALYPSNLVAINLLGSLQAQEKYSGVTLTNPDVTKWSPKNLMEDNCIHPTRMGRPEEPAGFDIIFENMWDAYWSKQLS